MIRQALIILTILITGLTLTCCSSPSNKWYEETKAEILRQSNIKADSIISTFNEDSTYRQEHYYFAGQEFLLKGYNNRILRIETYTTKGKNFELRREICDHGELGFEGIL